MKKTHLYSRLSTFILMALAALVAASCSSVEVHKVSEYDEDSKEFKGPEGFRYYLPRPYVSVYEPFVISSQAYILQGSLTPDGQFVRMETANLPDDLASHFFAGDGGAAIVPVTSVGLNRSSKSGLQSDDDSAEEVTETNETLETLEALAGLQEAQNEAGESTPAPVDNPVQQPDQNGTLALGVTNDNSAFAVTPTRRFFDIVFLPDFDEQYVITSKSRLGNADIDLVYGQGWSLQSLDAMVDNSSIVNRIFSLYDSSIQMLLNYASGQVGIALPEGFIGSAAGGLQAAGGDANLAQEVKDGTVVLGTPISLKVHVVNMVSPGIYPILKPSEVKDVTPARIAEIIALSDVVGSVQQLSLPTPPFTNVAYNTYEVIVVEAVIPAGDSPLNFIRYKDVQPAVNPYTYREPKVIETPINVIEYDYKQQVADELGDDNAAGSAKAKIGELKVYASAESGIKINATVIYVSSDTKVFTPEEENAVKIAIAKVAITDDHFAAHKPMKVDDVDVVATHPDAD